VKHFVFVNFFLLLICTYTNSFVALAYEVLLDFENQFWLTLWVTWYYLSPESMCKHVYLSFSFMSSYQSRDWHFAKEIQHWWCHCPSNRWHL